MRTHLVGMMAVVLAAALGISVSAAAQKGGGQSGRLGYTCGADSCTCIGDVDCNGMFSGGTCPGTSRDVCEEGPDGVSRCTCYLTRVVRPTKKRPEVVAPVGKIEVAPSQ